MSRTNSPSRLLFVATRPARDTTSGQLLMHRHLQALAGAFEIHAAHLAPPRPGEMNYTELASTPLSHRLGASRFRRWAEALDATVGYSVSRAEIRRACHRVRPDVMLTVAESPVFRPTVDVARALRCPLVTVVHDWSTVWQDMPGKLRPLADDRFLRDCRASTITLSVSQELVDAIGGGPRHRLLPPIPGATPAALPPAGKFHALYAGIFHYFHAAEMSGLCAELIRRGRPELLRLLGPEPDWSAPTAAAVRAGGFHAGMAKGPALTAALADAAVLLVICPFEARWTRFARYSFPSKLTEYCGYRRPILVWGPPYASAVSWAGRSGAARVVTDPSPAAVVDALLELEREPAARDRLAAAAQQEAATTFDPDRLNARFAAALADALHADAN